MKATDRIRQETQQGPQQPRQGADDGPSRWEQPMPATAQDPTILVHPKYGKNDPRITGRPAGGPDGR